jgi:hypothetical protein
MEIRLSFFKNSIFPHSTPLILQFFKRETHIHDISNTYLPFPQLFAEGKSFKSEWRCRGCQFGSKMAADVERSTPIGKHWNQNGQQVREKDGGI